MEPSQVMRSLVQSSLEPATFRQAQGFEGLICNRKHTLINKHNVYIYIYIYTYIHMYYICMYIHYVCNVCLYIISMYIYTYTYIIYVMSAGTPASRLGLLTLGQCFAVLYMSARLHTGGGACLLRFLRCRMPRSVLFTKCQSERPRILVSRLTSA